MLSKSVVLSFLKVPARKQLHQLMLKALLLRCVDSSALLLWTGQALQGLQTSICPAVLAPVIMAWFSIRKVFVYYL